MFHCPIHGSQINPPAKLYKRITGREEIPENNANIICYNNNWYKTFKRLKYIETNEQIDGRHKESDNVSLDDSKKTIKITGRFHPKTGAKDEPETTDLMQIGEELWVIRQIQRKRLYSLNNVAVLHIVLERIQEN